MNLLLNSPIVLFPNKKPEGVVYCILFPEIVREYSEYSEYYEYSGYSEYYY
jgi:hypothetical protein